MKTQVTKLISYTLIGCLLALLQGCDSPEPYQGPGTKRMVARLQKVIEDIDPLKNVYHSVERAAYYRNQEEPADSVKRVVHRIRMAQEMLKAGYHEEATQLFSELREEAKRRKVRTRPSLTHMLALSYMRLGEQENSMDVRNTDAVLFPVRPPGFHSKPRGSRQAIDLYTQILNEDPNDLVSRWLLNLCYMTLGEYPDRVPREWLIPPDRFGAEYDIGHFPNRAHKLGTDLFSLAGGSIMDDFDGDGFLDIMTSSWGLHDQTHDFHNNGDGSFTDRTEAAGLTGLFGGLNCRHTDFDNDGFPDVLILRGAWFGTEGQHPNSLLRNNGDGTFEDVADSAGVLSFHPTQTATWADFDNDGWVDLFIGNESVTGGSRHQFVGNSETEGDIHPCELYHNNGDGTFTEVAESAGVAVVGFVKAVISGDYDNDGLSDIYVSRLREPNLLFHNDGPDADGRLRFTEVGDRAGVREPSFSFPAWFWDYDNDGWLDIYVSGYRASAGDIAAEYLGRPHKGEVPRLYRNNGDGTFEDVTRRARIDKVMYTMGCNFGDLDNDGYLDFYVSTGDPGLTTSIPNRMFRNAGGAFFQEVTVTGGFGHWQKGHSVSFGDVDNDGDQDIHTTMGGAYAGDIATNVLFENPGHGNHWITLKLEGVESNRLGIGTRIRVKVQTPDGSRDIYSTVSPGASFGASSLQQEIGLGSATAIDTLSLFWPASGRNQVFTNVSLDRAYQIREDAASLVPVDQQRIVLAPGTR